MDVSVAKPKREARSRRERDCRSLLGQERVEPRESPLDGERADLLGAIEEHWQCLHLELHHAVHPYRVKVSRRGASERTVKLCAQAYCLGSELGHRVVCAPIGGQ